MIKQAEYGMSLLKVMSGILVLTLEKHNFKNFNDYLKVPLYMIVGSSISFLITYTVFDLIELVKMGYHRFIIRRSSANYRPAILTNLLYIYMVSMSCFIGGGLGIVYGIADIEGLFKYSLYLVYFETYAEIISLAPIGLIIGLFMGIGFGLIRAIEVFYAPELPSEADLENVKRA